MKVLYTLQRKCSKTGYLETITAWQPCRGWRVIKTEKVQCIRGILIKEEIK